MRDPETGLNLLGIPPAAYAAMPESMEATDATVVDTRVPDLSFWDAGTINGHCFRGTGITKAVVQADSELNNTVAALAAGGVSVKMLYGFLYFGRSNRALNTASWTVQRSVDLGLKWVCFDAEADDSNSPPGSATVRNTQLRQCIDMADQAGLKSYIYSAPWWWDPKHARSPEFAERGVKFWLANYGANDGRRSPIRFIPGFAWPECQIHQYWSLANYCGREARDMNYEWSDAFDGEEDDMTPEQVEEIVARAIDRYRTTDEAWARLPIYLDLAMNGGPSGYTDANGQPVIVRDRALVEMVETLTLLTPEQLKRFRAALETLLATLRGVDAQG